LAILAVSLLWIVVSYLPGVQAMLPTLTLSGNGKAFAALSVAALIIFIAIQLWLVYTTVATVRASQAKGNGSPFRLKLGVELFWTALPIAMTFG
jgi:heme/copper-type cytochrome/quinol oxidase subunit 2